MNSKKIFLVVLLVLVIGGGISFGVYYKFFRNSGEQSIDLGSSLSSIPLKEGSDYSLQISIENNLDFERKFEVYFEGLGNLARVDKESFVLDAGGKEFLTIIFEDLEGIEKGIYTGKMVVWSEESTRESLIVVDYESANVLFDSGISVYPIGGVAPGETLTAEITINDLELTGKAELELNYFVKDFSDKKILSGEEIISINGRTPISRSLDLPFDLKEGDYVFGVVLKYGENFGTSSSFFRVGKNSSEQFISENKIYIILLFVFVIFLFGLFVFYSIYSRERLLDDLRREYKYEIKKQVDLVHHRQVEVEKNLKTRKEKKISKKIFADIEKSRTNIIKKIHQDRIKKIKEIRKSGASSEKLAKQINKWKKQGYNTSIFDKTIKIPTTNSIQAQINKWKKQGYNTSVLTKY